MTIKVPATGPVHGWLDRNNNAIGHWRNPAEVNAGADLTTLGAPSAAARPLTVGSVREIGGIITPSDFSGCGPARGGAEGLPSKPDLVTLGEGITAPQADPADRVGRSHPAASRNYFNPTPGGTSYAAPQAAGACALLFERFGTDPLLGSPATWDDLRQTILQATVRVPNMPPPRTNGWEPVCGFGLLRPEAVQPLPSVGTRRLTAAPTTVDLWLTRSPDDDGQEPFVAWRFWDSPALTLLDEQGRALDPALVAVGEAKVAALRLHVRNRGTQDVADAKVAAWWAPLGALHPLPATLEEESRGAWRTSGFSNGNVVSLAHIPPHGENEVAIPWQPPTDEAGRILPHQLLGIVDTPADPYEPDQSICATNNLAVLTVAAVRPGMPTPPFIINGSDLSSDGAILWPEDRQTTFRIENLPVTALPWREAAIFEQSRRRERPLYNGPEPTDDPGAGRNATLKGDEIEERTAIRGARQLVLRDGLITVEGGPKLVLPQLRIAPGIALEIHAVPFEMDMHGSLHMLHLSGGRRVGGGTVRYL